MLGVSAGKLYQGVHVTDEMVNDIGDTIEKVANKERMKYPMQKLTNQSKLQQRNIKLLIHDCQIMQGCADGHVAIIGHDRQEYYISTTK